MNQISDEPASGLEPSFTETQGQYLAFICAYTRVIGRPPAEADMRRHFKVTAPSVHQRVTRKQMMSGWSGCGPMVGCRNHPADTPDSFPGIWLWILLRFSKNARRFLRTVYGIFLCSHVFRSSWRVWARACSMATLSKLPHNAGINSTDRFMSACGLRSRICLYFPNRDLMTSLLTMRGKSGWPFAASCF